MSEKFIPDHIDPFHHAEKSLDLAGVIKIADMQRLSANVLANEAEVTVAFQFGIDDQNVTFLKGHLKTQLPLQCQRCMEAFIYEIMSKFRLGVVKTFEEADALPKQYEPVLIQNGYLALRELIEDEIILNLPIIPKHAPEDCKIKLPLTDANWEQRKKETPFQILESLKTKE